MPIGMATSMTSDSSGRPVPSVYAFDRSKVALHVRTHEE